MLISHYKQIYDVPENIHALFHYLSAVSGIFPGTIVPNGRNSVRNDFLYCTFRLYGLEMIRRIVAHPAWCSQHDARPAGTSLLISGHFRNTAEKDHSTDLTVLWLLL